MLDVATGSGNTALAAARRGARVTAIDLLEPPLELARLRSELEGLNIAFELADAQALPFEDGSFDVVLSTFGVMFALDQQRAADELTRVCRPGGRIGLANWSPQGLVGSNLAIIDRYVCPSKAGPFERPVGWGTVERLRELVGRHVTEPSFRLLSTDLCAASASDLVATVAASVGPTHSAFTQLELTDRLSLEAELVADLARFNRATDGTFAASAEYLELVATRVCEGDSNESPGRQNVGCCGVMVAHSSSAAAVERARNSWYSPIGHPRSSTRSS